MSQSHGLGYRADIDGLRSVSILSVLFFHIGLFPAGFLGVDIFFVISGFLITSIIHNDQVSGVFTLKDFYARRIRRLIPAFIFFFVGTWILGYKYLAPQELAQLGANSIAVLFFASNWQLLHDTGYFAPAAQTLPLLHTWSLSVEEQFYLFFPTIFIAVSQWARHHLLRFYLVCLAASLALHVGLSLGGLADAAFYNSAARFWQLLAGCTAALVSRMDVPFLRRDCTKLALVGIGLLLAAVLLQAHPFGGFDASPVAAVAGATALILSGLHRQTAVHKVLSLPPFVFIGKISYSLYLWHWPLIVFTPMIFPSSGLGGRALSLVVSAGLATLSYYFLETPVRRNRWWASYPKSYALFGAYSLAFAVVSVAALYTHGFPNRFRADLQAIAAGAASYDPRSLDCLNTTNLYDLFAERVKNRQFCELSSKKTGPIDLFVLGDSHAWASYPLFRSLAEKLNLRAQIMGCTGDPPVMGAWPRDGRNPECRPYYEEIYRYIQEVKPRHVVLIGRWAAYLTTETDQGDGMLATDGSGASPTATLAAAFSRAKEFLGPDVFLTVMSQPPEFPQKIPAALLAVVSNGGGGAKAFDDPRVSRSQEDEDKRQALLREAVRGAPGVALVDVWQHFCWSGRCLGQANLVPMFLDNNHLSVAGARRIFEKGEADFSFLKAK